MDEERPKRISKSVRAGLAFPVTRIHKKLQKGGFADHIQQNASVYLAAVLEYLVAEIIETSGDYALKYKRRRIVPRFIQLAVRNDEDMDELLHKIRIAFAGNKRPGINPALIPDGYLKKATKKGKATAKVVTKNRTSKKDKPKSVDKVPEPQDRDDDDSGSDSSSCPDADSKSESSSGSDYNSSDSSSDD